jgi:NAD kinase
MRTSEPRAGEKIKAVRIDEDTLTVYLADGRTVSTPLAW